MRPKAAGSGKRTSVGVRSGSVRLGICRGNQLSFVKTPPAHAITRNSSRPGQSPAATLLTGHSHTVAGGMLLLFLLLPSITAGMVTGEGAAEGRLL